MGWLAALTSKLGAGGGGGGAPSDEPAALFRAFVRTLVDGGVARGDVHGDMDKTRRAFRLGGLIDENDRWAGGDTVAVQVGDQLDRGPDEMPVLYLLERLQREAERAGGRLHVLNGNHETMNAAGDTRYAHRGSHVDFAHWREWMRLGNRLVSKCGAAAIATSVTSDDPRSEALAAGGDVARRFFARQPTVVRIGETVFAHGGVLPSHVEHGLGKLNAEVGRWMEDGRSRGSLKHVKGRDAVVWTRAYSHQDTARCDCATLQSALRMIGARRMVVGHTIQDGGITQACGGGVLRVDVGLSRGCGDGAPQVLEIINDTEVRVLRETNAGARAMGA
eukprot:PRCOL_00003638-RA